MLLPVKGFSNLHTGNGSVSKYGHHHSVPRTVPCAHSLYTYAVWIGVCRTWRLLWHRLGRDAKFSRGRGTGREELGYYYRNLRVVRGGGWVAGAKGKYTRIDESTEFRLHNLFLHAFFFYSYSTLLSYCCLAAYTRNAIVRRPYHPITPWRSSFISFFGFVPIFSCHILPLPIPTLLSNSLLVMNFNDCNRFRMLSLPPYRRFRETRTLLIVYFYSLIVSID